jgi:hypothetical protein
MTANDKEKNMSTYYHRSTPETRAAQAAFEQRAKTDAKALAADETQLKDEALEARIQERQEKLRADAAAADAMRRILCGPVVTLKSARTTTRAARIVSGPGEGRIRTRPLQGKQDEINRARPFLRSTK